MKKNALIYANDMAYPSLKGDVVIYGGAAMSGAVAADVLLNKSGDVKLNSWVSASVKDLIDTKNTNRLNADLLDKKLDETRSILKIGILKTVEELPNGRLKLTFINAPKGEEKDETSTLGLNVQRVPENNEVVLECDQLVVGIGGDNKTLSLFKDISFEPVYSSSKNAKNIPVGTKSSDGRIMTWGATGRAAFGINDRAEYAKFNSALDEYVQSLPAESRGASTILSSRQAIREEAQSARRAGLFPVKDITRIKTAHDLNNITESDLMHKLHKMLKKEEPNVDSIFSEMMAHSIIQDRTTNPEGVTLGSIEKCRWISPPIKKEIKSLFFSPTQLKVAEHKLNKNMESAKAPTFHTQFRAGLDHKELTQLAPKRSALLLKSA